MKSAPVTIAMSWSSALRRSPNPGALIAATEITPLSLLTTRVARASPADVLGDDEEGQESCVIFSRTGMMSLIAVIFWSVTSTRAFSNSTCIFSLLVTNWEM